VIGESDTLFYQDLKTGKKGDIFNLVSCSFLSSEFFFVVSHNFGFFFFLIDNTL
jgi:hypothetical protein